MTSLPALRSPSGRSGRRWFAALAATTALLVSGCGGSSEAPAAPGAAPAAGFPRTITHAMGETEIPAPPQRVAALDSSFVDATVALETPVAAYTRFPAAGGAVPAYYSDTDRRFLEGAREVGTLQAPDVEALYDVAPDLVVSAKIRHEALYPQFQGVAPTVFSESTGITWKENIRLLGQTLGKEQLAEQKISAYEARAQRIGDAIRAKSGRNPSVSLVRFTAGEPTVRLHTTTSYPGIVLFQDAGLARAPGQPDTQGKIADNVSQEQINTLDADLVLVSSFTNPAQQASSARAQFEANPLWGTLRGQRADIDDTTWFTAVSLQGAERMLDQLAQITQVDPR